MELKAIRMQDLDEQGWKDYCYLGKNVFSENPDEWSEFKKDRLEQYEKLPLEYKMEEYLLKNGNVPIGWLAYTSGNGKYRTFILDITLNEINEDTLKNVLKVIYSNMGNRESIYVWSKNPEANNKLLQAGAELTETTEGGKSESQFNLSKSFLEAYIK